MTKRLSIEGMTCHHCAGRVTSALTRVQGVTSAKVDVATKSAIVEGPALADGPLKEAVADAGYEVVAIEG
jgi:copper chaperone